MELLKVLSSAPAKPVELFGQIKVDAFDMLDMLDRGFFRDGKYTHGAALHHAQVSEDPFDFFVISDEYKEFFGGGRLRRIIVNPKITNQKHLASFEEGCLTFLNRPFLKTRRFAEISMICWNPRSDDTLRYQALSLEGFPAFMVQHECDHGTGGNIHDGRFAEYNPRVEMMKTAV